MKFAKRLRNAVVFLGLFAPIYLQCAPRVYVTHPSDNSVSVIDTETNHLKTTLMGFSHPEQIIINEEYAYVSNSDDNTISVIKIADNSLVTKITLDATANNLAMTNDGKFIYVSHTEASKISVINAASNQLVDTLENENPGAMAITPNNKFAYVLNAGKEGNMSQIDLQNNKVVKIHVSDFPYLPHNIAIAPDGKIAYIAGGSKLIIFDTPTNSIKVQLKGGNFSNSIVVSPNGKFVYTSCPVPGGRTSFVQVYNTEPENDQYIVNPVHVDGWPDGIAITPDSKSIYVSNASIPFIHLIDAATKEVTQIDVKAVSGGIAITSN